MSTRNKPPSLHLSLKAHRNTGRESAARTRTASAGRGRRQPRAPRVGTPAAPSCNWAGTIGRALCNAARPQRTSSSSGGWTGRGSTPHDLATGARERTQSHTAAPPPQLAFLSRRCRSDARGGHGRHGPQPDHRRGDPATRRQRPPGPQGESAECHDGWEGGPNHQNFRISEFQNFRMH